jgi:hypothetical protein
MPWEAGLSPEAEQVFEWDLDFIDGLPHLAIDPDKSTTALLAPSQQASTSSDLFSSSVLRSHVQQVPLKTERDDLMACFRAAAGASGQGARGALRKVVATVLKLKNKSITQIPGRQQGPSQRQHDVLVTCNILSKLATEEPWRSFSDEPWPDTFMSQ